MDRLFRHVPRPELAADHLPNLGEGRIRDSRGVGSHISYQADKPFLADLDPFVQLLRQLHGLLDREAQLARGFLLQLRSDKRRDRVALFLSGRDRRDDEALALQFGQYVARLLLFFYMDLALLEVFAEIGGLDGLLVDAEEPGVEGRRQLRRQVRRYRPVLGRHEGEDIPLALDDQPQRDRLDPARRQPAPDFVPEQGADLIAHDAVEQAARLLRIDEVLVDLGRVPEGFLDSRLGYLVEEHPADRLAVLSPAFQLLLYVPADSLALAVRVGRHIDHLGVLGGRLELLDDLLFSRDYFVRGLELLIKVDADALLRQVLDVPNGRDDVVIRAEVLVYRLR